jgi:curved DNA-binding protein CbpA
MDLTTSFKLLGLDPQADEGTAKRAYKAQVRRWHPDQFPQGSSVKAGAEEQLKQINIAYARVKAHLALHRPDPIDEAAATSPHPSSHAPHHHETPPRKAPQRSWVDHLFDALNAFAGHRAKDPQPSSADEADTKRERTFEQVLNEMTGGFHPTDRNPGTTNGQHARCRYAAMYKRYRRHGGNVEGVGGMESRGPVKPVGRVRGIGRNR